MNRAIHAVVAVFFGAGCWMLWALLTVVLHTTRGFLPGSQVPPFTSFCISWRPVLVVLPVLALVYCGFGWFRRRRIGHDWVGYFAVTMGTLVLLLIPTFIASWLPLVAILQRMGGK